MKIVMTSKVLFLGALASLAFVSCSEKDVYDAERTLAEKTVDYNANFIEKYGDVDPNQTWDFTSGAQLNTRAGITEIKTTQISGIDFGIQKNFTSQTITKNSAIYEAIGDVLPEGEAKTGEKVVLLAPSNSFWIFPISVSGQWTHEMKVKIGNESPVTVYNKTWTDYSHPWVNGMYLSSSLFDNRTVSMPGLYVEAPVGTPIQIYLDNVKSGNTKKPSVGTHNGQAIYLDVPESVKLELPFTLLDDAVIKYIGIEDQYNEQTQSPAGDKDYNDVVVAIVGNPSVPEEITITEGEYTIPTIISKRYMVEDLGTLDDFDFNDVVVDVFQETNETHKVTYTNGVPTGDEVTNTDIKQYAIMRAMGGTLDFVLNVGQTSWRKSTADNGKFNPKVMYNTEDPDYNAELSRFDVTGWNPDDNNISVTVYGTSESVYTIQFPKAGTVPMVIAVDNDMQWMLERVSVPDSWWYIPE